MSHRIQALGQGGEGDAVLFGRLGLFGLDAGPLFLDRATLGGRLDLKGFLGDGGVLEGLDGGGHLADLVLAARGRDGDRGVARSQATHGRRHRRQRLGQNIGQHHRHAARQRQRQQQAADQHHAGRPGGRHLLLAIETAFLNLLLDQSVQRAFGRVDEFIGLTVAADHGDGLHPARLIGDHDPAALNHLLVPLVRSRAGRPRLSRAGAVQLDQSIQALVEALAMLFDTLKIIGVARHQEAAIAGLLTRQIELRRLGLTLDHACARTIRPRRIERIDLQKHRQPHGDDGQNHDRKGRHQFLFDLQVAQHGVHLTLPP